MGEVYRAKDTRLGREVAVKVLPSDVSHDVDRLARFEREAKAVAALSHPNILALHDVGEANGIHYVVTELLEGETLRDRFSKGALPQHSAVEIGVEIAHGLAAAHAKGIVHRDLKPANVFVTSDGVVKILDFGLAKLVEPEAAVTPEGTTVDRQPRTESGTVLGTMGFTSPEQLRGEAADARSDIFSFGCVLYEMLSGRSPFLKPTGAETITAIMSEDPEPLSGTGRAISPALKEIVNRCLEKRPDDRFSTAHDLALALRAYSRGSETPTTATAPAGEWLQRHRKLLAGATLAAALAVAAALIFANRKHSTASGGLPSVLALPCTVYGAPEVAFLTDAVPGTISTLLSQVEGLDTKVPPTSLEVEKVKGDLTKLADLYQVSSFIVTSITTSPGRFALNVQLVDAPTRKVRWGKQYEGAREAYNDLARQAAEGVRQALGPHTASRVPTAAVPPEAELAFREGVHFLDRYANLGKESDFGSAQAAFSRALSIHPTFATAAAKVAVLNIRKFEYEGDRHQARKETEVWARRALSLDPRCGEAWGALAGNELYAIRADPERGIDYAVKAVAFAPRDPLVHLQLGLWSALGTQALRAAANQRAFDLDPFLLIGAYNAASSLCWLGRPEEALALVDQALKLEPDSIDGLVERSFVLLNLGRLEEAEKTLRRCESATVATRILSYEWPQVRFALAVTQRDGTRSETLARQILASALDTHLEANFVKIATFNSTPALTRMGRTGDALSLLERSVEVGLSPSYDWLLREPAFLPLRGNPRFARVLTASRDAAAMVARVLGQARERGELPKYLETPLDDLRTLLNEKRAKS